MLPLEACFISILLQPLGGWAANLRNAIHNSTLQYETEQAMAQICMAAMQGLQCQHGPEECRLNRIFGCAIDQARTWEDYWPFVECVESNYGVKIKDSLEGCAKNYGFKLKDLEDCASGDSY